jgi:hypothetical protein
MSLTTSVPTVLVPPVFGELPVTPMDQPLSWEQFHGLVLAHTEGDSQEQVLQVLKHAAMALSVLVGEPHGLHDFHFQLLATERDEFTREVLMLPCELAGAQRHVSLSLQLDTGWQLLYVHDVTVRGYFASLV